MKAPKSCNPRENREECSLIRIEKRKEVVAMDRECAWEGKMSKEEEGGVRERGMEEG